MRPSVGTNSFARRGLKMSCLTLVPSMGRDWPGPGPAAGLLSCVAKKVSKEGDPASAVGLRPTSLRCSRQAAGAELALRAQTAAPEGPACHCAARRLRRASRDHRAFTDPAAEPSLFKAWVSPRFDYNEMFSKGSASDKSPFRTAEQRRARRSSPGRLSERAKPASSAPAAGVEQRRAVVRVSGRPVWPGRLSCLLLWRRKEVGRPPGRDPADEGQAQATHDPVGTRVGGGSGE